MSTISSKAFRVVLVALGLISAFVAANVAFGGLDTLGWQGPTDYFRVTDQDGFLIRDSHARFYGGVYLGIAGFLILAASNVSRYRTALALTFTLIFFGGLARLTQLEPSVVFGPALIVSTIVELVGMPALAVWLRNVTKTRTTPLAHPAHQPA